MKKCIVDMALNSSGIRDISRVLSVAVGTVITMLKKAFNLVKINMKKLTRRSLGNELLPKPKNVFISLFF